MTSPPDISIVVPVFNETEKNLRELIGRILSVLQNDPHILRHELILVDDGSGEHCKQILRDIALSNPQIIVVTLSRNFGEQAAIAAGLAHAKGKCSINMDSDLQDPPELIPQMLAYWRKGYDIVCTRQIKRHDGLLRGFLARIFYRLLNSISEQPIVIDGGEFRLLGRKALDALLQMPEINRFFRVQIPWMGFKQVTIDFERERRSDGSSGYRYNHLFYIGTKALLSASPLLLEKMWLLPVLLLLLVPTPFLFKPAALDLHIVVSLQFLLTAVILSCLSLLAAYIAVLFVELRKRPMYLVESVFCWSSEQVEEQSASSDMTLSCS